MYETGNYFKTNSVSHWNYMSGLMKHRVSQVTWSRWDHDHLKSIFDIIHHSLHELKNRVLNAFRMLLKFFWNSPDPGLPKSIVIVPLLAHLQRLRDTIKTIINKQLILDSTQWKKCPFSTHTKIHHKHKIRAKKQRFSNFRAKKMLIFKICAKKYTIF